MLLAQPSRLGQTSALGRAPAAALRVSRCSNAVCRRRSIRVCAKFSNPFENFQNPFNKGGGDAAKKSLENMFGGGKGGSSQPGGGRPGRQQPSSGGGFMGGAGAGGSGGGGDGGGWKWGANGEEGGESGPEQPIWAEFKQLMRGMWVTLANAAVFLAFANMLHRSLDWCCQVELLLLVGAPTQAFERLAGRFYMVVEWLERNLLGWDMPGDEETMPLYQQLALYYPQEHAYTFDQYRYPLTTAEKDTLRKYYALRWWERDGGFAGDVDPAEVAAIHAKYDPLEADRKEYLAAKAAGTVDEFWAARRGTLAYLTGSPTLPSAEEVAAARKQQQQQQQQRQALAAPAAAAGELQPQAA